MGQELDNCLAVNYQPDRELYQEMRRYERLRNAWLDKYGTLDLFDEWLELHDLTKKIG